MLNILLTIDIDSDLFDQSLTTESAGNLKPSWTGLENGVPLISELFNDYRGSDGLACKATWFIRADSQIGYYYGDNAYLFTKYQKYWKDLLLKGHELAWHPHLYKFHNGNWEQELDSDALGYQMNISFKSIPKAWDIKASRIGEAYFSNSIAHNLRQLGIKIDSTALPGRFRQDEGRTIDWLNTPSKPYFPSEKDYRVPGHPEIKLLEVPFSMIDVFADYDKKPLKRYTDLSFWHHAVKDGIEKAVQENMILNTIIHPSTVIPGILSKPHGLLSFSIDEVKKNLDFILHTAKRKSIEYRFITISQVSQINYEKFG
jgi:hypothetical protein